MNAREEYLRLVEGKDIECVSILFVPESSWFDDDSGRERRIVNLRQGYTEKEYKGFLNELDFEYDSGYGLQQIHGTIWFKDGTWAERENYDGAEWWDIKVRPEIPQELRKEEEGAQ